MDENVKKVLQNLGVLDILTNGLLNSNALALDDMLCHAGFGFDMIKSSFPSTVILTEGVSDFVVRMREKQKRESLEQPFALFGRLSMQEDGKVMILLEEYAENINGEYNVDSSTMSETLVSRINAFLNDEKRDNKVLLLGHTHPLRTDIEVTETKKDIIESIFGLEGNPLKLRTSGLNISVSDVALLVNVQEQTTRSHFVLEGIVLPNGEFNIFFYDGDSIQSLDDIYTLKNGELTSITTFRNDKTVKQDPKLINI